MTKNTIAAIKGSILHWERILLGREDEIMGPQSCPLCQTFRHRVDGLMTCGRCPVKMATGRSFCEGTPYYKVVLPLDETTVVEAWKELGFLRRLLLKKVSK
jgi:hypothetical protein